MKPDEADQSTLWKSFLDSLKADDVVSSGTILSALQSEKDRCDRESQGKLI